jgi:signal transduction histidine kinase
MTKGVNAGVLLLGLGVALGGFLLGQFRHPIQWHPETNVPVSTLPPSFDTESLNNRMLVCQSFAFDTAQSVRQLTPVIRRSFRRNPHPEAVLHGNAALAPVGWAFIELRNATDQPRQLVLSMPQYRAIQATLWMGQGDRFVCVGTLRNNTPLGERFYPFLNYAFPISIPPRTTVPLLLRTQFYAGFHEVDVRLSHQHTYADDAFIGSLGDGVTMVVFALLAVVALLVGGFSGSRLLVWFGVYLSTLTVVCANIVGYLSLLPYPAGLALSADTVGLFCRIWMNPMIHPFFYQLIKPAVRQPRRYWWAVSAYSVVSGGLMALFLLPPRSFDLLNYGIINGMTTLTIINTGWVVVWAVLAYRRAGIRAPLVVCVLALAPIILAQVIGFVQAINGQDTYRQIPLPPFYFLFILSYLVFNEFRKELVTRQGMRRQVREVAEHNEALRREEIDSIGRDLHDQVGNTLATALSYLGRTPVNPDKLRSIILSAISELRFLSHNLVKDDDRPLTDKVETLVSRFTDFAPVRLTYTDYTQQQINQLAPLTQQNLYRIIQELLTNVIRHSGATQATVQFFYDGTTVDVSVEDDGVGFDVSAGKTNGIGIQTIYKRAALSGIEVRFDPTPTGTSVLLQTALTSTSPTPILNQPNANPNYSY